MKEFIKKWKGKHVDFDGVYPDQCMDLMHQYVYEVLEIKDASVLAAPSAYQVYTNFRWGDLFYKIPNTPMAIPKPGDIIVWGQDLGSHGHIAIVVEADLMTFRSFDANFPYGSLPHIQEHTYSGVLGWLRPKTPGSECLQKLEYERTEKEKYKKEARELRKVREENERSIKDLSKNLADLNTLYKKLLEEDKVEDKEMQQLLVNYDNLTVEYNKQLDRVHGIDLENQKLKEEIKLLREEINHFKEIKVSFNDVIDVLVRWLTALRIKEVPENES